MQVLLIEDEKRISDFVCSGLNDRGFAVQVCEDGNEGFKLARKGLHSVVVLDIMLPGRDGFSILKELRASGTDTPIILLTARNELGDRVDGLNLGADDYLAKPFFVEELAARIQALLRRKSGSRQNILQVGNFSLDRIARLATCHGHTVELTSREFTLIEFLMRSAGQLFTRTQILEHVWGYDFDTGTNIVDSCVKRIRKKIASINSSAEADSAIESVRGVGYRYRLEP